MKKGEKRKQDLIQIAYRMFVTRGYEHTSVDEIIAEAGIAKGTYYYYFESKEQMLEDVIGMMLRTEAEKAEAVLSADLSVPEKIAGIIASIRPAQEEETIEAALHQPENALMHNKARERMFDLVVPLLSRAAEEGVEKGLFHCDHIPERVREILILSSDLFDGRIPFSTAVIDVFIDTVEKILGAEPGTMDFIRALIRIPDDTPEKGAFPRSVREPESIKEPAAMESAQF